jgi:hypothetical protein
MSARRSAGTIFWGLTLLSIGALLLAHNLGYPLQIWPFVVRYWPALLIVWGLLKFVDYFRFRQAGDNRPMFSGGEVVLLIFVIFAGSAITTAANVSPEIGRIFEIGEIDLWDITGDNYTYEQRLDPQIVPPGSAIEILNSYGDIEVRPAESDNIVVDVRKTIRASSKAEADRLDRDFIFSVRGEGSTYRIRSNLDDPGFHSSPRQRFRSSLTISVPRQAAVRVENRSGRVLIQNLTGNQIVFNRYGDVDVRDVTGNLDIENRNATVTVQDVTGSVAISNRYSNTTVKNIGSDLRIQTRNGSIDVASVKGNATIENRYAPISVEDVQGDLTISGRNNSVDVRRVDGDIQVDSSYQNVTIKDPRGAVKITSRNGDLLLSFVSAPRKDVSVEARYGNVTMELPASSAFKVDARTQFGEVDSEFEGLRTDRSNRERTINGEFGQGGPNLMITTRNGHIRLRRI